MPPNPNTPDESHLGQNLPMKDNHPEASEGRFAVPRNSNPGLETEMLLLPSGELLVHNLTPTFAALLAQLGFDDGERRIRTIRSTLRPRKHPTPPEPLAHT